MAAEANNTKTAAVVASSVLATLFAAGIALECTGRFIGGTWNGPMWLAARVRYGLCKQEDLRGFTGYNDISSFISHQGRGVLTVEIDSSDDCNVTFASSDDTVPNPFGGTKSEISSVEKKLPSPESPSEQDEVPEEEVPDPSKPTPLLKDVPVDDMTDDGTKIYYGWHGVWAWLSWINR